jgi:hypothetical protein
MNFLARKLRNKMIEKSQAAKIGPGYFYALQGRKASEQGLDPSRCPYVLDTPEWRGWYAGWCEGQEARAWP